MTGYGRGESAQDGYKVTVELSSVNRKQGEISVTLPRDLEVLEAQLRDLINKHISRGRITARVTLHSNDDKNATRVKLNTPLARAHLKELTRLAKELKVEANITLDMIIRAPGVFETDRDVTDAEDFWPAIEKALQHSLNQLLKMREQEGSHLSKDLAMRIKLMRKHTTEVQKRAPEVLKRYREELGKRLRNAGVTVDAKDEERLLKEIVLFADRSDISEELARLQSHFNQFDTCIKSSEPVGRTLDFLAQEMNREINTIGSKANDSLISHAVVSLKTELEKFREQAQNVE